MSTFKRFLAWALVILSIIGILACTIGIVGGWVINNRLTDRIQTLLSGVQEITLSIEDSLTVAGTYLNTANTAINNIRDLSAQLGEGADVNTPILDRIGQAIQDELSPAIERIREVILPIWERVLAINATLETLNTIPGINLPTISTQLQALNDQINEIDTAIAGLKTSITDFKAGVVTNVLNAFMEKFEPIATLLASLEQKVNTALEQINQLQAAITNLQAKIATVIDVLTILVSIWLAWIILGQISLIVVARYYLKSGKMIWAIPPSEQEKQETALVP